MDIQIKDNDEKYKDNIFADGSDGSGSRIMR